MTPSQQTSRLADTRDAYRNGFIDGLVYRQGADKPTDAQFAQAVDVLMGHASNLDVPRLNTADIRLDQLAALNLLRLQLSELT